MRAAADELSSVAEDEPFCKPACKLAGEIAAGLEGQLRDSLAVLLMDTTMIDPITVELMSIDELAAAAGPTGHRSGRPVRSHR